jgi:hypothetical protein
LRCQIGTSKEGRGGRRYMPYAFTEQGVAMRFQNIVGNGNADSKTNITDWLFSRREKT